MLKQLATLIDSGRCPQSLVIDGGTKEARIQLATEVAAALVGTDDIARHKVQTGSHPDVTYIRPEDKKKTLSVEVIRNMRNDAFIVPNESDYKVYIIEQAELMQEYAQNALLKILEEPPSYGTFILCCESKSVLLGTVLSRVAAFSLNEEAGAGMDDKTRTAVRETAGNLAKALVSGQELHLLRATATLEKNYEDLPLVLDQLELIIRDALVQNSGGSSQLASQPAEVQAMAQTFSNEVLFRFLQVILDLSGSLQFHANKNLTLSRLCSNLMAAALGQ